MISDHNFYWWMNDFTLNFDSLGLYAAFFHEMGGAGKRRPIRIVINQIGLGLTICDNRLHEDRSPS
jgi:hypothetical protein